MISRQIAIATAILLLALLGLSIYAFQLKRRADQLRYHATDSRPIAPPVAGPTEPVILLVASDADGTLSRISGTAPLPAERTARARQILRALFDHYAASPSVHPIPERSDISAVFLIGENLAVIDLNSAFADAHPSGIMPEELTIASIAQTLSANIPTITRVKFLIDGKERDTLAGHADLRTIYDVSAFNPFVNVSSSPSASPASSAPPSRP